MRKSNRKAEPLAAKTAAETKAAAPKLETAAAPKTEQIAAESAKVEKTTAAVAAKAEKAAAAAKAKAEKAAAAAAAKAEKAAAAAAAKAEKAAAAAKAKAEKAPVVRKRSKKAEVKLYVQYQGRETSQEELVEAVKAAWTGEEIERLELYVKPEDGAVYYVINGAHSGKVDF